MEKSITKKELQEKLKSISTKRMEHTKHIEECNKGFRILEQKKAGFMLELAKLNGEERVIRELLSTVEPPKKSEKKKL